MMELNPLIGTALVEKLCTTKDQNVCVNLLRLLHLSVNSVNYASRLVMLRLLREEGVMQFIQDGLKEILEKQKELIEAKTKNLNSNSEAKELYNKPPFASSSSAPSTGSSWTAACVFRRGLRHR